MTNLLESTQSSFETDTAEGLVLVDFWAEWCGPCRVFNPILEQIAEAHADKLKVLKVDIETNPDLVSKYSIQSVPTLLVLSDGEVTDTFIGAMPKAALEARLEKYLT